MQKYTGPMYALNEAALMLHHAPNFGWALKVRRILADRPSIQKQRFSSLLCIRNNNQRPIVKKILFKGSITAPMFHQFLLQILLDRNAMIVLDNVT